jgi:hypothetical protein
MSIFWLAFKESAAKESASDLSFFDSHEAKKRAPKMSAK